MYILIGARDVLIFGGPKWRGSTVGIIQLHVQD